MQDDFDAQAEARAIFSAVMENDGWSDGKENEDWYYEILAESPQHGLAGACGWWVRETLLPAWMDPDWTLVQERDVEDALDRLVYDRAKEVAEIQDGKGE